jgi:cytochrome c-type biogenesis protein CcmH/NrfG
MILGRLHYKSPNIILILTWPDKNKAKAYIEEVLAARPDNLEAKMFLADIIWDIGDREAAKKLYREVVNSKPKQTEYYYDSNAITDTAARMKELEIQ